MADSFSRAPEYMDLVAKQLAICIKQSTLGIEHIYNIHMEADHSHSKVEESTISHNEPDQPHWNIAINGMVSIYD